MKKLTAFLFCAFIAVSMLCAEVTSITLSKNTLRDTETDRNITVTVKGTGFKTLKSLHVQLSREGKNQSPVQCQINTTGTEATAVITIPEISDVGSSGATFIVRAIENFTNISSVTASIRITPPAAITRVSVTPYEKGDSEIDVKLSGRYMDIRGAIEVRLIDSDGVEAPESRVVLPPPAKSVAEEPVITQSYRIGDLVLRDGSVVSPYDYNKRRMGTPAGVIAYERDGYPYMIGVASIQNANTGYGMQWCQYSADCYSAVEELNSWCTSDYCQSGRIEGSQDGSEAWNIIQMHDPDHTSDYAAEDYYPAFWYAETYGSENNLYGTKYETGWFIPSLWELSEIYKNKSTIDESFSEFGNYDTGYRRYRSSSQNPYSSSHSPGISFDDGYIWNTYSTKDESDVYVMVVCPVFGSVGNTANTVEVSLPVPSSTGIFTVEVYMDGTRQSVNGRVQIAGEPQITRVDMPSVSIDYCGQYIPVIIYGRNFSVGGVNSDSFIVFGLEASQVRIVNDTQAQVELKYPDTAGSHEVTFVCKDSIYTGNLNIVRSATSTWAAGDVILSDGSKIPAAQVSNMTAAQKSSAVGVVVFTKYGLVPYAMGLDQNENVYLMEEYNVGYNQIIRDISCTRTNSWYADSGVVVTGDTSGYDNWAAIQEIDPAGTKNASSQYPGFYWANNYGISHNLPASCSDGWFIPSLSELVEIYKNRYAINASLSSLGKTTLMSGWYSTSSQDPDDSDYIWRLDFSDGEIDTGYKDSSRYELVIRQFGSTASTVSGTTLRRN